MQQLQQRSEESPADALRAQILLCLPVLDCPVGPDRKAGTAVCSVGVAAFSFANSTSALQVGSEVAAAIAV